MKVSFEFSKTERNNIEWLVNNIGIDYMLIMLMEEFSEAQKECAKIMRSNMDNTDTFEHKLALDEEYSDVVLMAFLSGVLINEDLISSKLQRFVDRMNKLGYN